MATEFTLPELGENIAAGDVVRVLVAPGDTIAREQPVLELETDKATIEVPSSVGGRVVAVKVSAGDKVKVGQVILAVEETDGAGAAAPARSASASDEAGPARQPSAPEPARPRPTPVTAPTREEPAAAGRPRRGEVVDITRGQSRPAPDQEADVEASPAVPAAPSVRRLARELGVDISRVPGTGPGGRIAQDDVKNFAKAQLTERSAGRAPSGVPLPDFARWGEVERHPMSGIRRKTAEHTWQAWSTIPHVTQHDKADVTALEALRKRFAPEVEAAGGKLTLTAIALKVVSAALVRFPRFNSSLDLAGEALIYKRYVHIGVAVDTERGLLVPVIRDVDGKSLTELSVELAQLSEKARARKLALEDMEGGSFTITNLGGIGGTSFTPIVNAPEVAILGMARARLEPVFANGAFEPRLLLPLSLSYDHRVIDGADAARFLRWLADAFEQPFLLSL
jgi:pyruvate dehydrogenase E2 component (dihydrolipoamide acetyltransferase)